MALCLSRPLAFLRSRQLQPRNYNHHTVSSEYLDLRRQFLQPGRRLYQGERKKDMYKEKEKERERGREGTGGMKQNRPEPWRKREGNQEHLRVPPSTTFFVISSRKIARNSRLLSVCVFDLSVAILKTVKKRKSKH